MIQQSDSLLCLAIPVLLHPCMSYSVIGLIKSHVYHFLYIVSHDTLLSILRPQYLSTSLDARNHPMLKNFYDSISTYITNFKNGTMHRIRHRTKIHDAKVVSPTQKPKEGSTISAKWDNVNSKFPQGTSWGDQSQECISLYDIFLTV